MTKSIKTFIVAGLFLAVFTIKTDAQVNVYGSHGGEIIFSQAMIEMGGDVNVNTRFTAFFHTQSQLNIDFTDFLGVFTGIGIRNVGYIIEGPYQSIFPNLNFPPPEGPNTTTTVKRRSYSLGAPVALKIGSFGKNFFIFGGAEYEWMFHYKQKLFFNGDKQKDATFTEWNSNRVNRFIPSVFGGIQFPKGIRVKFKYYLDNFLNQDFMGVDFGEDVDYRDYGGTQMWYISVATMIGNGKD